MFTVMNIDTVFCAEINCCQSHCFVIISALKWACPSVRAFMAACCGDLQIPRIECAAQAMSHNFAFDYLAPLQI